MNSSAARGKRKAAASPERHANFPWGEWFDEYLKMIKTKPEREKIRKGAFLITDSYSLIGHRHALSNNTKNAIYQLTHLNASHIAGLMGLWAELAIREGIRIAQQNHTAKSRRRSPSNPHSPGSPTTHYIMNRPLRSPATRVVGNNINNNNNITKSPSTVDYVMFKWGRFEADRYAGISPFNFVFKKNISNAVKPWAYGNLIWNSLPAGLTMRDAHVTCFEKVRVDWNWVKIWCGAMDTLDVSKVKRKASNGTMEEVPIKRHSLPASMGGALSAHDVAILQSAIPNIFPDAVKAKKIRELKDLLKYIFERELTIFKGDAKGTESGETDGQFLRAVLNSDGVIVGYEFIDDELKISIGKDETYPGEDVQLLKKMVLNSLFLNCEYPGHAKLQLIKRTRSFFVAFGIAALSPVIKHRKISESAGPGVAPPRGPGITHIATEFNKIFDGGRLWNVYEVKPTSSPQRKLLAFPGCSFSGIVNKVKDLRNDYEKKLSDFFKQTGVRRIVNMIGENPDAYMAILLLKDYGSDSRNFSACRTVYIALENEMKDQLGNFMSGMKKSAFGEYYKAGGGPANVNAAWGLVGRTIGKIREAEPTLGRLEDYFAKTGRQKGGNSQITGVGLEGVNTNYLKIVVDAMIIFDAMLRAELANIPAGVTPSIRVTEVTEQLMNPGVLIAIKKFVNGIGKVHVSSPRYKRGGNVPSAEEPPKASSIIRRVMTNASTWNPAHAAALKARINQASENNKAAAFVSLYNKDVNEATLRSVFTNYNLLKQRVISARRRMSPAESQGSNNNMGLF